MQKLNLSEEEKLSRKEYLKKKRKQTKNIIRNNKKKHLMLLLVIILMFYVLYQFYVYYKENNYVYSSDENVDNQQVYDMYYLSVGYTYDPNTSLNKIKSNGFDETLVYKDLGFSYIKSSGLFIYGIKEGKIQRLNLENNEITDIYEGDIVKYTMYKDDIYAITGDNNRLIYINGLNNEYTDLEIDNVIEILIDENNIFLCIEDLEKKSLVKYDKDGANKVQLTKDEKVSYIMQNEDSIFFVNKSDENKIYYAKKDGSGISKLADITSVSDTGAIKDVDGSKYLFIVNNYLYYINTEDNRNLWKINLEDKTTEKVISMSVDILEKVGNTVFYKVQDEKGVYLFNLDTKFTSLISSRLITEFIVKN